MSVSDYTSQVDGLARIWPGTTGRARSLSTATWLIGALVVAATVIRLLVIDNQSFWQDEALTVYEARIPFGAMLHVVVHVETTPPLYFVVAWVWGHMFGTSEAAIRMPSTIAGVALVPISYLCGKELVSRRAGLVAAALVVVNPFMVWYSQEARAYMLLAALCGLSLLWFIRARGEPTARNLFWWALCSALAVLTHFFAGFLIFPQALWLLWAIRTRLVTAAVAAVGLVQAAMLPLAAVDVGHGTSWIAGIPLLKRIAQAAAEWGVSLMYRRAPVAEGLIGGVVLIALVAVLVLAFGDQRTFAGARVSAVLAGLVWLLPVGLALAGQDYFLSRNVMPAVVPLAVLLGAACTVPRARILGSALAAVLLAMFCYATVNVQTHPYLQRPDWRAVARALGPANVGRVVLASGGTTAQPLKVYLPGVDWTESPTRRLQVAEVDVVGALKPFSLRTGGGRLPARAGVRLPMGDPVPRSVSVPGATLLERFRVDNWMVARFELRRPVTATLERFIALAPRYFRHTPQSLLAVFEPADGTLSAAPGARRQPR